MAVMVTAERLRDFCRTAFTKAGLTPEHAAIVAQKMVATIGRRVSTSWPVAPSPRSMVGGSPASDE